MIDRVRQPDHQGRPAQDQRLTHRVPALAAHARRHRPDRRCVRRGQLPDAAHLAPAGRRDLHRSTTAPRRGLRHGGRPPVGSGVRPARGRDAGRLDRAGKHSHADVEDARTVCETYLPGLLADLATVPLAELEVPGNPGARQVQGARRPGAGDPEAVRGPRRIGIGRGASDPGARRRGALARGGAPPCTTSRSRRCSLWPRACRDRHRVGAAGGIATNNLLVSSGFAEGRPGQGILVPTMTATAAEGGYLVNGSKKPCSLSRSMDLLTASVGVAGAGGSPRWLSCCCPPARRASRCIPFWASNDPGRRRERRDAADRRLRATRT